MKSLSTTSIEILKFLTANLTRDFTILKIAQGTHRTIRLTYETVWRLVKDGMIIIEGKANLRLCRLNLRMPQVIAFVESIRWQDFVERRQELSLLVTDILRRCELPYLTLLVFGSYARGTATKRSDMDILIIIPDRKFEESIEVCVKSAKALSKITLHHIIVSYSEFVHMLGEKKTNIAKEALDSRYIAYGAEPFYEMVGKSV